MSEKHTAHTPGLWIADAEDVLPGELDVEPSKSRLNGGYIIARLSGPDRRANARLIAAAPDLLKVLKTLCEAQEDGDVVSWHAAWDDARAAIALATNPEQSA